MSSSPIDMLIVVFISIENINYNINDSLSSHKDQNVLKIAQFNTKLMIKSNESNYLIQNTRIDAQLQSHTHIVDEVYLNLIIEISSRAR